MLEARGTGAGIPPEPKDHPDAAQEAVVKSRRSYLFTGSAILAAALAATSLGAGTLRAQTSEIVPRLPANTVAFVEWAGTGALSGAAQQNHVLELASDPGLAPLWLGLAEDFQKSRQNGKAPPPPLSLPEIASLLQNPAAAGIIEIPRAADGATTAGKAAAPAAMFVVYDASGKTAIIDKWENAAEAGGPKAATVTHFDFGGTTVEARTRDKETTYSAMAGHYFVASSEKPVIEELIARFGGSGARPPDSLAQRPEYAEVRKFIGTGGAFDYFARVPNLKEWMPANEKDKNRAAAKLLAGLHLDKVQAMGGSVSFAGEAMHVRGAILGNTLPESPFDFAGASEAPFRTLAIAGGAPEFGASRVNLGAMYRLIVGAVTSVLPEERAASLQAAQGMAQGFLGMPIPDALDLFTGELAAASTFSEDGTQQRVFAATIQKPDAVLRILRAVLGPMTLAEDTFGDATVLDIAYPYRDPATGLQRRRMYYVAVTPQMLLVAPRKAMLRETLGALSAAGGAAAPVTGVFASPEYAPMRARLPEKLSGLGAEDLTQIPWNALWQNFERRLEQSARRPGPASRAADSADFNWMKLVNPDVIPQHVHMAVSGWWKDTNGVYFDSYVQ